MAANDLAALNGDVFSFAMFGCCEAAGPRSAARARPRLTRVRQAQLRALETCLAVEHEGARGARGRGVDTPEAHRVDRGGRAVAVRPHADVIAARPHDGPVATARWIVLVERVIDAEADGVGGG